MLVNFSSTLGTYWIFLGQKKRLIFHPLSTLISPSGWLPKAITAPWKCSLRVQWWNTFQLGPKKPPKPLLPPKKIQAPNPKSQSQPSVHCILFGPRKLLGYFSFKAHIFPKGTLAYHWLNWNWIKWPKGLFCVDVLHISWEIRKAQTTDNRVKISNIG